MSHCGRAVVKMGRGLERLAVTVSLLVVRTLGRAGEIFSSGKCGVRRF